MFTISDYRNQWYKLSVSVFSEVRFCLGLVCALGSHSPVNGLAVVSPMWVCVFMFERSARDAAAVLTLYTGRILHSLQWGFVGNTFKWRANHSWRQRVHLSVSTDPSPSHRTDQHVLLTWNVEVLVYTCIFFGVLGLVTHVTRVFELMNSFQLILQSVSLGQRNVSLLRCGSFIAQKINGSKLSIFLNALCIIKFFRVYANNT